MSGFILNSDSLWATLNPQTGEFSWTPSAGDVGDHSVTFTVTDNGNPQLSDSKLIKITVMTPQLNPTIDLQSDGIILEEIGLNTFLDINVTGSSGSITKIRFSSDDLQNGNAEGKWTQWYDWSAPSGDWNSDTHIMKWSFASLGKKEVWMEIRDNIGLTIRTNAKISVHPGYAVLVTSEGGVYAQDWRAIQHMGNNAYVSFVIPDLMTIIFIISILCIIPIQ